MRNPRARTAVLAFAAVTLTAGLTACGGKKNGVTIGPDKAVTTSASPTGAPATASATASAAGTPAAKATPTVAKVGGTLTLTGQEGERLAVTLKGWTTSVRSGNEYDTPETGKTWVAGQFEIRNVGTVVYDDSPSNCVQASDGRGQRFDSGYVDTITAGPVMPSEVKLIAGDKALGWVVFEVPKGTKVTKLQFTPNSGFAEQTGQWSVG